MASNLSSQLAKLTIFKNEIGKITWRSPKKSLLKVFLLLEEQKREKKLSPQIERILRVQQVS